MIGHHSKTKVKFLKIFLSMLCLEERNEHSEMKKSTCSGQTGKFGPKIALLKAHSKVLDNFWHPKAL